jgi:outer membrane protein assembly factor BamE (lipoprotein component of BamABCDE complex)
MRAHGYFLALALAAFGLTACSSKMTEENLRRVHNGMPSADVREVLGSPTTTDSRSVIGMDYTTYTYHRAGADVTVTFFNDKVVATQGDFK